MVEFVSPLELTAQDGDRVLERAETCGDVGIMPRCRTSSTNGRRPAVSSQRLIGLNFLCGDFVCQELVSLNPFRFIPSTSDTEQRSWFRNTFRFISGQDLNLV